MLVGALMVLQARVNAALSVETHDATIAATISFGGGLLILAALMLCSRSARAKFGGLIGSIRRAEFPWWFVLGGAAGAFYVFSQGQAVPVIGIALFTVAYVSAQSFGSLGWDRLGVGPSGAHHFTPARLAGAGLTVVAVGITVLAAHGGVGSASWLVLLPVLAGIGASWQQAANGRVRQHSGSVLATTFWNFALGTAVLLIALLLQHLSTPLPSTLPAVWWMYLGGPIGAIFIAISSVVVRFAGVLMMSLTVTLGQLLTALILAPLTPSAPQPQLGTYLGTALALLAVAVTALPSRTGPKP